MKLYIIMYSFVPSKADGTLYIWSVYQNNIGNKSVYSYSLSIWNLSIQFWWNQGKNFCYYCVLGVDCMNSSYLITILLTLSNYSYKLSESQDNRGKFTHLFDGVSLNKKSRLFVWLLLIRRAVFVNLLITLRPKFSIMVISFLVGFQIIYLVLLVATGVCVKNETILRKKWDNFA